MAQTRRCHRTWIEIGWSLKPHWVKTCWPVYLGRVLKGLFLYSVLAHYNLGLVVERDQDHRHEGGHGQAELPLEVDGHADGDEDAK